MLCFQWTISADYHPFRNMEGTLDGSGLSFGLLTPSTTKITILSSVRIELKLTNQWVHSVNHVVSKPITELLKFTGNVSKCTSVFAKFVMSLFVQTWYGFLKMVFFIKMVSGLYCFHNFCMYSNVCQMGVLAWIDSKETIVCVKIEFSKFYSGIGLRFAPLILLGFLSRFYFHLLLVFVVLIYFYPIVAPPL